METIVLSGADANPGALSYIFHWLKFSRTKANVWIANNCIIVDIPILAAPGLKVYLKRMLANCD